MATRKTMFEVVKLEEIAPLLGNAEILGNGERADRDKAPARILSITFDRSLAATREMLFNSVGFQVFSASTVDQAIKLCADKRFELIVIGHSMPLESRRLLVRELRRRCAAPLLALQRPGETPVSGVDRVFDSTLSPARLLAEVIGILRPESDMRASSGDD